MVLTVVDLGLMTSLMTSSRIIIIDTKRATSQTSLPLSFTEVLVSFKRCALLRYLHRLILASEPCCLPACSNMLPAVSARSPLCADENCASLLHMCARYDVECARCLQSVLGVTLENVRCDVECVLGVMLSVQGVMSSVLGVMLSVLFVTLSVLGVMSSVLGVMLSVTVCYICTGAG